MILQIGKLYKTKRNTIVKVTSINHNAEYEDNVVKVMLLDSYGKIELKETSFCINGQYVPSEPSKYDILCLYTPETNYLLED